MKDLAISAIVLTVLFASATAATAGLVAASWSSGGVDEGIKHYDQLTGAYLSAIVPDQAGFNPAYDFVKGPDGYLYAAHFDHIRRHDLTTTGTFGSVFVPAGSGGLGQAWDVTFGPDGNLYVPSSTNDCILRYSGATGAFLNAFVPSGAGGLDGPTKLFFHNGALYVASSNTDRILRYDSTTGAYLGQFAATDASDFTFGPGGDLFVVLSGSVRRYNGITGALIGTFTSGGPSIFRSSLTFGPDGHLYVGGSGTVQKYNGATGAYLGIFIPAGAGLQSPTAIAFMTVPEPTALAAVLIPAASLPRRRRTIA